MKVQRVKIILFIVGTMFLFASFLIAEVECLSNLEEALKIASKNNMNIALTVSAEWCPYCQKLEKEIFQTSIGEEVFKNIICVKVDFDTSYGQKIKRKYRIIGLPTVVFLNSKGKEIDRVIGYDSKEQFLELVKKYGSGKDSLPLLQEKLKKEPNNPELIFEVGKRLLLRGNEENGIKLLKKILTIDPNNSSDYADNALFVLGRYYSRVKENPEIGLKYWRELFFKYPNSDYGTGALSWMLRAYKDLNKLDEAHSLLKEEINKNPDNPYLYFSIGYFYLNYNKENLRDVLPYIKKGLELASDNLDLLILSARIYENLKMNREAIENLERALELEPDNKSLRDRLKKLIKQEKSK